MKRSGGPAELAVGGVRSNIRETWVHDSRNAEAPRTFLASPHHSVSGCRTFYDARRAAINRETRTDLYIDIGALKYTNVPLIGLSPPVRTYKSGTSLATQITADSSSF